MQNIKQKYRIAVHTINSLIQSYFLQHIRYHTLTHYSKYRYRPTTQYIRLGIVSFTLAYALFNIYQIENYDRFLFRQIFMTQYTKLIRDIRKDKNNDHAKKVVLDIIKKSKIQPLKSIQILALSELIKKPQLSLHAQYIASLK